MRIFLLNTKILISTKYIKIKYNKLYFNNTKHDLTFPHIFHLKLRNIRYYSTSSINSNTSLIASHSYDSKFDNKVYKILDSVKYSDKFIIAFTHKFYKNPSYDRLEFLGDFLINFYTSKLIFNLYKEYNEGDLTKLRSTLVSSDNLNEVSIIFKLDKYLLIDKNAKISNKVLADIFESFSAVLYLEKGDNILIEFLYLTLFSRKNIRDDLYINKCRFLNIDTFIDYKLLINNNLVGEKNISSSIEHILSKPFKYFNNNKRYYSTNVKLKDNNKIIFLNAVGEA